MHANVLQSAAELLRSHYGRRDPLGEPRAWETLLNAVLAPETPRAKSAATLPAERLRDSILTSPEAVAQAEVEVLTEALQKFPRGKQRAGALRTLARWWTERLGENPNWLKRADLESLRDELRALRGVRLELADRILLHVFALPTYPLDRGSIRMAARHGWIGPEAEYDEWQSFFVQGLTQANVALPEFSQWAAAIGREFCGPTAKCDDCPLNPLLPPGGPYEPESD